MVHEGDNGIPIQQGSVWLDKQLTPFRCANNDAQWYKIQNGHFHAFPGIHFFIRKLITKEGEQERERDRLVLRTTYTSISTRLFSFNRSINQSMTSESSVKSDAVSGCAIRFVVVAMSRKLAKSRS